MNRLRTLLDAVASRRAAPEWIAGKARVAASYDAVLAYLHDNPQAHIYGFNTLSGHRDDHRLDEASCSCNRPLLCASHIGSTLLDRK